MKNCNKILQDLLWEHAEWNNKHIKGRAVKITKLQHAPESSIIFNIPYIQNICLDNYKRIEHLPIAPHAPT